MPFEPVYPALERHRALLVLVPLPHQGRVADPAGLGQASWRRGPATQRRRVMQQEGEVRGRVVKQEVASRGWFRVQGVVGRHLGPADVAGNPGRVEGRRISL